jgi:HEAT repeat protein
MSQTADYSDFCSSALLHNVMTDNVQDKIADLEQQVLPFGFASDALVQLGKPVVEPLIACLNDQDWKMRLKVAMVLGKLGDARAVEPLIARLKDKEWEVRGNTAFALGKLRDVRAVEPLIAALQDFDMQKSVFINALGELGDSRAAEQLIACLRDQEREVRVDAAIALGKLGDARAVEPLISCLKYWASNIRESAAAVLGNLRDVRAVEPLIACLKDPDWNVQFSAAAALGKLGKVAVQRLIACLQDQNEEVRKHVTEALGDLGDAQALEPLIAVLKDGKVNGYSVARALCKLGEPAIEPLIACLKNQASFVRSHAASALGDLGDARAVGPLIACFKDRYENENVRNSVARALGKMGDARTAEALGETFDADLVHIWISLRERENLKRNWAKTKRVLLADMQSSNRSKMESAVYAFVSLGNAEILPQLIEILDTKGDVIMKETYLNCGNDQLEEAARSWASRHCYSNLQGGTGGKARWGDF